MGVIPASRGRPWPPRWGTCPRAPSEVCGVSEAVHLPALSAFWGWTWVGSLSLQQRGRSLGLSGPSHPCRRLEKGYFPRVPPTVHSHLDLGRGKQANCQTRAVRASSGGRVWAAGTPRLYEAFFVCLATEFSQVFEGGQSQAD